MHHRIIGIEIRIKKEQNGEQKRTGTGWRDRGGIFSDRAGSTDSVPELYLPAGRDWRKQRKICRVFDYFRMKHRLDDYVPVRFDVVEVDSAYRCHWIKNAFEYQEM